MKLPASCARDATFLRHHSCCCSFGVLKLGFESPVLLEETHELIDSLDLGAVFPLVCH